MTASYRRMYTLNPITFVVHKDYHVMEIVWEGKQLMDNYY